MDLAVQAVVAGLAAGAVYALVGMGYNVVFASTRIFNLAQGQILMLGVMFTWMLREVLHWPTVLAIVGAALLAGAINVLVERLAIAPLYLRRNATEHSRLLGAFITTLGASIVLQNLAVIVWGVDALPFQPYFPLTGLHIGGVTITAQQVFMVAVAVIAVGVYSWFTRSSRWGVALLAMSEDSEAALLRGIPIVTGRILAFFLAGVLSGLGGAAIGPIVFANPSLGFEFGLKGFVAIAIGGFGSTWGALIGGMVLGMSEALLVTYGNDQYRTYAGLALLLIVLLVRPRGLAGRISLRHV
jgi:branched-chain amino acid transport system permease protein